MLPLPPRQNVWAVRAEHPPRCRLPWRGLRGIATRPSVGEVASNVFGVGQIAKASSDPARNDFGSKRLGDRIQARRRVHDIRVDQKNELGKMGGLGTAKCGTSCKPKEKTDAQSLARPCDRVAVRRIGGAYRRRANLARGQ